MFGAFDLLKEHEIDLSIRRSRQSRASRWLGLAQTALQGQIPTTRSPLSARFEFSQLPVDGGAVLPHTDSPSKIVSFVIPLVDEGEVLEHGQVRKKIELLEHHSDPGECHCP